MHPELFDKAIIMNCPHAKLVIQQTMLYNACVAVDLLFSLIVVFHRAFHQHLMSGWKGQLMKSWVRLICMR